MSLKIAQEVDNFIKEIQALHADKVQEDIDNVDKSDDSDDSKGGEMDDVNQHINDIGHEDDIEIVVD